MAEPRKLRGHKATATCCIASRDRPGLVATSGEDGCICWFDMRCKDVQFIMDVSNDPISSLSFKSGNEDIIYVSSEKEIKCFDLHKLDGASWKPLGSYNYNKDEINQIACNSRSSFLASADDTGDVKIIDIHQHCIYKTLRAGHASVSTNPYLGIYFSFTFITIHAFFNLLQKEKEIVSIPRIEGATNLKYFRLTSFVVVYLQAYTRVLAKKVQQHCGSCGG